MVHIPDGYLSPQTCGVLYAAMVPAWWRAGRRTQAVVTTQHVPLLALGAAFSFVVMMFNIPIPDGTTAHAVGAGPVAVLLGPSAACISVSIALLMQALFFGDGDVLAFAANAANMALAMPWAAYLTYRLITRGAPLTSRRRVVGAAVGGYVGINTAALLAAVEFGLQPELFHRADGTPLYSPFHLSQTIPAMMLGSWPACRTRCGTAGTCTSRTWAGGADRSPTGSWPGWVRPPGRCGWTSAAAPGR